MRHIKEDFEDALRGYKLTFQAIRTLKAQGILIDDGVLVKKREDIIEMLRVNFDEIVVG